MTEAIEVAKTGAAPGIVGMEDVENADLAMPVIKLNHTEAVWEDSLSGEKFEVLDAVLLGLIKGRILWPTEVGDEKVPPLCKSYDFEVGYPGKEFPFKAAGLDVAPGVGTTLACATCPLKDWGSNPSGDTPWCSEQHTYAILTNLDEDGQGSPAVLTLQRSAIKPSRAYLSAFARTRQPLFTVRTTLTLDAKRRGTVSYAVPKLARGAATPGDMHGEYANTYLSIRDFVQTPRVEEVPADDDAGETAPAAAATPAAAPADDEVPF